MITKPNFMSGFFRCVLIFVFSSFAFLSCGLFDKEIKQDKEISAYRYRMERILDSLSNPAERVNAFTLLISDIDNNKALITPRKKNGLLIEANTFISSIYYGANDFEKALEYNNIVINLDSTRALSYFYRGCTYQEFMRDSLAIIDYTQAISLDNNYADAYYNRGIVYEKAAEYEKALKDYNKAESLNPVFLADVYNNRGNVHWALKDTVKALDDYNMVLSIDTLNVNAYTNRARLFLKLDDVDKALTDCNKALMLDSTSVRLYHQRAEIYKRKKEYNNAIADYQKVLKLDPNDVYKVQQEAQNAIKELATKEWING